jgi:hypothetical protein
MSSNIVDSLRFATQQSIIYTGFVALVSGVIGNILNIIIFTSLKTFRKTSCAFYLTIASAVNIVQLLSGLMARIVIAGYHIDLNPASLFLCKLRLYIWTNCELFWLTCLCFAAIDQFASLTERWRHLSNIRVARRLVIVALVFWGLYCIPVAFFSNIYLSPTTDQLVCAYTNPSFSVYYTRFLFPVLLGCLPIVIRVTFALLSFHRVRGLARRQVPLIRLRRDKQLTAMV